jgi:diadenosine tetraphosphate (Ap4A) HIT family hydrolase
LKAESAGDVDGATCTLCRLIAASADGDERVAHNDHGVVLLNRFASRPGHLLVVAPRHVEHVDELSWADYAELQRLAYEASAALRRAFAAHRVYSAVLGSAKELPNSYPHLHIHVVPIQDADERARPARVFTWSEGVFVYEDAEARALIARIQACWSHAAG